MPTKWNFFENHVQKGLPHGQFLSGRATVIGAGPPNLLAFGGGGNDVQDDVVYLIGLTQNMSIAQQSQVQRIFEVGSIRQYFITGHNITNMQVNRILYHGPNLLRAFYAYYSSNVSGTADTPFSMDALIAKFKGQMPLGVNNHTVQVAPGEQNFFINMTSDLFSQPIGLLLMLRDQDELTYGLAYAENCYIDNYVMATDANSILLSENANIQCERILPIGSGTVDLITTLDEQLIKQTEDGGDIQFVTSA
jgi:hypothetical protein